jgi:hypothetical protein
MTNTIKKRMSRSKVIMIIVIAIVLAPIVYVIGILALDPVFDSVDKARFETLDKNATALYQSLKSAGNEDWTYEASCFEEYAGIADGRIHCSTNIILDKTISSVNELNMLHNTYFGIIDQAHWLKPTTELDKQLPNEFGVVFNYSTAEKGYEVKNDNRISCRYITSLTQIEETYLNSRYGKPILGESGLAGLSIECSDIARESWFKKAY